MDRYKYTTDEKKEIIKSMVIISDTREKSSHVKETFDSSHIKYISKKLDYGDYSFMIPKNEKLGILRDMYFDRIVVIERKGSIDELAGNLTKERDRLEKELSLAPKEKVLLIEDNYHNVLVHGYRSQMGTSSLIGSIHKFWFKYQVPMFFIEKRDSPYFIKNYFEGWMKNYLR